MFNTYIIKAKTNLYIFFLNNISLLMYIYFQITCPELQKDVLLLEEQEGSVNFKIGVMIMKPGQKTDDEMLSNGN